MSQHQKAYFSREWFEIFGKRKKCSSVSQFLAPKGKAFPSRIVLNVEFPCKRNNLLMHTIFSGCSCKQRLRTETKIGRTFATRSNFMSTNSKLLKI